jgi:hypothetical protein
MAEFFDYNPGNGMIYHTEMKDDQDMIIRSSQDVEPVLRHINEKRKHNDDSGIKRSLWHYCTIPTHVELELLQKGINIHNKHQTKELLKEINTNYPYLKVTRRNHAIS